MSPSPTPIRGLIGVVHLPAMPGDPRFAEDTMGAEGFAGVTRWALADADALVEGGVDALIVENFGSAPFPKGTAGHRLPPHQVAAMTVAVHEIRRRFAVPVGVNCLRNDARAALGVAAVTGADFIRVNVHTGAYVTDQGVIEGEADRTLRYRAVLGANVSILADVLVKHATPLAPTEPAAAAADCVSRGLADGLIVTGSGTGRPVDPGRLDTVRRAAGAVPVFLGSGLTPAQVDALVPECHGAIVGTWLKRDGQVQNPVSLSRVRELVARCQGRFASL